MGTVMRRTGLLIGTTVVCLATSDARSMAQVAPAAAFQIQEATIGDIHAAIRTNAITCRGVVQAYVDRAKAYNGVCSRLVTKDGAAIASSRGYVRAGSPIVFPTRDDSGGRGAA